MKESIEKTYFQSPEFHETGIMEVSAPCETVIRVELPPEIRSAFSTAIMQAVKDRRLKVEAAFQTIEPILAGFVEPVEDSEDDYNAEDD